MIIVPILFLALVSYNTFVDKPPQKNTKEVYEQMKRDRK